MEYKQKLNNKIMIVQDEGLQKREKSVSQENIYTTSIRSKNLDELLPGLWRWYHRYVRISKLIKMDTLYVYNSLYIKYSSTKLGFFLT